MVEGVIRLRAPESTSIDKLSSFLHGHSAQIDRAGRVVGAIAKFGRDVVIFETSLLTLAIAEMVAPVTPIASVCASAIAATALVAVSIDMTLQIEELTMALADAPADITDGDVGELSKTLDAFAKPFDALLEKLIKVAGDEGAPGSDSALFAKAVESYIKARADRQKATGVNKVKYILAEMHAAKKVILKGKELIKKKLRGEEDGSSPRGMFQRDKSEYPNGVDYPEQPAGPGAGPPRGHGGTGVA